MLAKLLDYLYVCFTHCGRFYSDHLVFSFTQVVDLGSVADIQRKASLLVQDVIAVDLESSELLHISYVVLVY